MTPASLLFEEERVSPEVSDVRTKLIGAFGMLVLVLGACGGSPVSGAASDSGGDHSAHSGGDTDSADSMDMQGEVPGSVADPSEADTEVLVVASDDLEFSPASVHVEAGDVVTFVVRNEGQANHEFVLGDESYQEAHEKDMEAGHDMSDLGNAVTVAAGETEELTWKFTEAGSVLFGCHEPGHYEGGMVGTIEVG